MMLSEFRVDCGGGDMVTTAVVIWWVRAEDCRTGVLFTTQEHSKSTLSEFSAESLQERHKHREREGCCQSGLCRVRLTQALAHGHAVLLWVEIVAVAGTATVYEAHTLPLAHVEVPAGHGGTAGASLSLQGANRCQGTAVRSSDH